MSKEKSTGTVISLFIMCLAISLIIIMTGDISVGLSIPTVLFGF